MELRRLRLERNLSQEALAGLSNVSPPTIHRIEHGQQVPHRSTVVKLAKALRMKPSDIAPELFAQEGARAAVELTPKILQETVPYIKKAARRLALNSDEVEDLVAAGLAGLVEASQKYDPTRGVPFDRYARWIAICRAKDEARRLYKQHPGFGLDNVPVEPWTY